MFLFVFTPCAFATSGGFHGGGTSIRGNTNTGSPNSRFGDDGNESYGSNRSSHFYFHSGGHYYGSSYSYISSPIDLIFFILFIGGFIWKFKKPSSRVKKSNYVYGKDIGNIELEEEIEKTFMALQEAWDKQDLLSVKKLYSYELYDKHQKVMKDLLSKGLINHTNSVVVDGLSRYKAKAKDKFEVDISFVAIDFSVDRNTQRVVQGNNMYRQDFKQRWTFITTSSGLIADDIKELKV